MPSEPSTFTIAEGRKVLAGILCGRLRIDHNNQNRYVDRSGPVMVDCEMFVRGPQRQIAAIFMSAAELSALHVMHHGNVVLVAQRLGFDTGSIRNELNAIAPFRWRQSSGKLGREEKA